MGAILVCLAALYMLTMVYVITFSKREKDERGTFIISKAYQFAYAVLLFGILAVFAAEKIFELNHQLVSNFIVISVFVSVFGLAGSIFYQNQRS